MTRELDLFLSVVHRESQAPLKLPGLREEHEFSSCPGGIHLPPTPSVAVLGRTVAQAVSSSFRGSHNHHSLLPVSNMVSVLSSYRTYDTSRRQQSIDTKLMVLLGQLIPKLIANATGLGFRASSSLWSLVWSGIWSF